MRRFSFLVSVLALIAGCDQLGIETPAQQAQRAEAEGRAMGSACRHSGRALEDCYQVNKRASKAAIYAGWREMDAYMRENGIKEIPATTSASAQPKRLGPPTESSPAAAEPAPVEGAEKPAAPGKKVSAATPADADPAFQKSDLAGRRSA